MEGAAFLENLFRESLAIVGNSLGYPLREFDEAVLLGNFPRELSWRSVLTDSPGNFSSKTQDTHSLVRFYRKTFWFSSLGKLPRYFLDDTCAWTPNLKIFSSWASLGESGQVADDRKSWNSSYWQLG